MADDDQQRHRRRRERKARAGDGEDGGAEPGGLRVVAAVDLAADADRDQDREDREGGGDQAEPDDRQVELDGAVRRGDAHHRGDELHQHGADQQRHEQAVIGVAGAEVGGELFEHRSVRLADDAPAVPTMRYQKSKKPSSGPRRQAAAGALAGPVAGIEMRPAGVGIVGADAIFHLPGAARLAIAPAGVRRPDRGGALALRIGRLVDDAALEDHLGPVFQRVVAGGRWRGQTQDKQQHHATGLSWRQANHARGPASRRVWTLWMPRRTSSAAAVRPC